MSKSTIPQVFIIESLEFADEEKGHYEGRLICEILHLQKKEARYYYIRTKAELVAVLEIFWESNYRYLHFSCHGNRNEMVLTLESIAFHELEQIVEPYLEKRRLFLSACLMSCNNLAKRLLPGTGCYSILGPAKEPFVSDAAIFWASFYQRMFRLNRDSMNAARLLQTARCFSTAFSIPLNYYASTGNSYRSKKIIPKATTNEYSYAWRKFRRPPHHTVLL